MGLQSSMTTALTGLQAAETTIDVTGNNVANSNTVGFKEGDVLFATQFLRTIGIGSAPNDQLGGTNPRQIGLGVKVAEIKNDFTQGTIEISANPLDVAIQGDGFLVVQGGQGEELFTRAGQLNTNASNQVVTPTGNRVLGFTVDDDFVIDSSTRVPLSIPLGEAAVAQSTQNATFAGTLTPTAEVGDMQEIVQSQVLGTASIESPPPGSWDLADVKEVQPPGVTSTSATPTFGVGSLGDPVDQVEYSYRVVYATAPLTSTQPAAFRLEEGAASIPVVAAPVPPGIGATIDLTDIPQSTANPEFSYIRIYRADDLSGGTFQYLGEIDTATAADPTTFTDDGTVAVGHDFENPKLDGGNYSYYVTFFDSADGSESRPSELVGAKSISSDDRRILLTNLPQPDDNVTIPSTLDNGDWDRIRIYRNVDNGTSFHLVETINTVASGSNNFYIDSFADSEISGNPEIDLDGPKAVGGTLVTDLLVRDGSVYTQPFQEGVLTFAGRRGGRTLTEKEFDIGPSTTVADLLTFMRGSLGIHTSSSLPTELFPDVLDSAGVTITNGQINVTSNHGQENALSIGLTAFQLRATGSTTSSSIGINFSQSQAAVGPGATADILVFDSLGIPIRLSVSTVLESKTSDETTYRWFAYSPDNEPLVGVDTSIGNGIIRFDNEGNVLPGDIPTIAIDRNATASASPLEIALDFNNVSGLASVNNLNESISSLNVSGQDGFPPGVLTSFIVTESGLIRGVFSNGTARSLGQVLMARFANNTGLQAVGDNMFTQGVNSGEPIFGEPGTEGLGTLLGGAVELSNTDIGQNLIELILASTQYRGNARVITTAQELLDELLALRR